MIQEVNSYFYALKGAIQSANWRGALEMLREGEGGAQLTGEYLLELLAIAASTSGGEALIPALVANGADPMRRNINGQTAFEEALMVISGTSRPTNTIETLLQNGIDPNCSLSTGFRPLHLAASRGDIRLIHLFKRYGADPSLKSADPDPIDVYTAARLSGQSDEVIAALFKEDAS